VSGAWRLLAIAALGLLAPRLAAQLPEAEAAFQAGRYAEARTAYERVLAADSLNARALYRLAILDSWDGKLARALGRLETVRRLEPADEEVMLAHARVLSWAGRYAAATALYDTLLARAPDQAEALAGRARTVAWSGDLDRAAALWRAALQNHPDDAELLVGLAQTLFWKGETQLAESYAARARQLAPEDKTARDLLDLVRAAVRPDVLTSGDYAHDSDENAFALYQASYAASLGAARGTLSASWRHATDPFRAADSYGAAGLVVAPIGHGTVLRAGLGVRRLAPDSGAGRTRLTAQVGLGLRPARAVSLGVSYSRTPFDETALLIGRGFRIDGLDFSAELAPKPRVAVSLGGGPSWFSDGNRRIGAVAAVMVGVGRGLELGALGRGLGFRDANPGRGYFAPDRFTVFEGRGAYTWRRRRWGVRADGGIGTQRIDTRSGQTAWHAGLSVSRGWAANSELVLAASVTNSAAARSGTAVAAGFKYWTVGLRLRQGL
jgi:tetratricopeptide (TPR) repeat protein